MSSSDKCFSGCTIPLTAITYSGDPCNPDNDDYFACKTDNIRVPGDCLCLNMNGQPCGVCYGHDKAYAPSKYQNSCFSNSLNQHLCAPVPGGGNCKYVEDCVTGGVCTQNLCQNPLGEPCNENSDCISNVCVADADQGICKTGTGGSCCLNGAEKRCEEECASKICLNTVCVLPIGAPCI